MSASDFVDGLLSRESGEMLFSCLVAAVGRISDPGSPSYRKYMNSAQFADLFGATEADYQTLLDWVDVQVKRCKPDRSAASQRRMPP